MIKILKYGEVKNEEIFARVEPKTDVSGIVADIIYEVRKNGDSALYKYCEKFDGAKLSSLLVSKEEIEEIEVVIGDDSILNISEVGDCMNNLRPKDAVSNRKKFIIPLSKMKKKKKEDK